MIAALEFGPPQLVSDRIVRAPIFRLRSTLPLSAACLVANGTREELGRLLAADIDVELVEPAIPEAEVRRVLFDGAFVVRASARLGDTFVVVRPLDGRRLAGAAFGETGRAETGPLSEIETKTLERIVAALVPLCAPLAGAPVRMARERPETAASECVTYFEVRTTARPQIAIGFGLTRDPAEVAGERLTIDHLAEVELEGRVRFAGGRIAVPAFSRLGAGATVTLETRVGEPGTLLVGDVAFAAGECGTRGGRNAFTIAADLAASTGWESNG